MKSSPKKFQLRILYYDTKGIFSISTQLLLWKLKEIICLLEIDSSAITDTSDGLYEQAVTAQTHQLLADCNWKTEK